MRSLSIFLAPVLVAIAFTAAAAAELDGFRGLKWGTDLAATEIAEQKGVEGHMGAMPGVAAFQLKNEDLNFGGVKVDGITYAFYQGKFTSVSIDFRGFDKFEKLLAHCRKLFGTSSGSATMRLEYYASFESPRTGALLLYQFSTQTSNYGRLYLYSRDLLQ